MNRISGLQLAYSQYSTEIYTNFSVSQENKKQIESVSLNTIKFLNSLPKKRTMHTLNVTVDEK